MRNSSLILPDKPDRLALVIGNSRLHWAVLSRDEVLHWWDTDYLGEDAISSLLFPSGEGTTNPMPDMASLRNLAGKRSDLPSQLTPPLVLASVVPEQAMLWQRCLSIFSLTLDHIPLKGIYPTLGIDRALAVLGAGDRYGFPVLVIDGGTALTFTGVDSDRTLIGGAILPGLSLQGRSLSQQTATLPDINFSSTPAGPRWANSTPEAIRSGILYTILAGIADFVSHWRHHYPTSAVVFTGGDGEFLLDQTRCHASHLTVEYSFDPVLIFRGIQAVMNAEDSCLS